MMTKNNARQSAMALLCRVLVEGGYSNIVLNSFFSFKSQKSINRELVSRLFYGVLERKLTLDHIISQYSKVKKIQNQVRTILEMAIYELLYMKSQDYAVVNEYVGLAKISKNKRASGFVNAVLREFIRKGKYFSVPLKKDDRVKYLSVMSSCSEWIVKSLIEDYGFDIAQNFLRKQLEKSVVAIRVNSERTTQVELLRRLEEEGIKTKTCQLPNCLLVEGGNVAATRSFSKGFFHIQDISSQICAQVASFFNPHRVLDVCAAPGGKTLTIAQETSAEIVACDILPKRVELIRQNAKRLGLGRVRGMVFDARDEFGESFDLVLCDVPCSGFGVVGRKPEIKYKKQEDVKKLTDIQRKILCSSSKSVKCGGYLIYSTCTLRKAENERVVNEFLADNQEFKLCDIPKFVRKYFPNAENMLTMIDGKINCDGFFLSVLRRKDKID